MNPTDTIIALEEALEAGPAFTLTEMRFFHAAANPLAIRTLLDAHASALRDAERLRTIIRGLVENEGAEAGVYLARGIGTASASGKRWLAARAALTTNTKETE